MPKDLVTGASGLVGSALQRVAPMDRDLVCVTHEDVDFTNYDQTLKLFERVRPERVFHCAAAVAGLGGNIRHPGELFRKNILINFNVLEAARVTGVKRLLSYLSTCIYPDHIQYPIEDNALHKGPPHPSNYAYAYAKRMLDVQSRAYRDEFKCDFFTAVGTNLFGPHDNFSLTDGHAFASLIHKTYLSKKNSSELRVWGSGRPLREFVFSEDIAKLSFWAMDNYHEADPIMFSNEQETSIKDLVKLIANKLNFSGQIIFDESKPDGQFRKPSSASKIRKYYPGFKFTPLDQAVEKTVDWFLENYPRVRM